MLKHIRNKIIDFINRHKAHPFIAGMAAGLYPLLYLYNANFTLLNSWSQWVFFCFLYLLMPTLVFFVIRFLISKNFLRSQQKYLNSVIGLIIFAFLIVMSTYGIREKKIMLLAIVGGAIVGFVFFKHYNKIIVFQIILAVFMVPKLIPDISKQLFYSHDWMKQDDDIVQLEFKKKPNIYVVQPDGYVNFSELYKGKYNFDNSLFEQFLEDNGFINYPNFRSNYYSTLSSNTSMFAMKHHYYNDPKPNQGELFNSREIIVGKNPVLSIFKNNGYTTNLILEHSYLLVNRPKLYYDNCNIAYRDISFFARGFEFKRDVISDLEQQMTKNREGSHFYFIEKISPGHITSYSNRSDGASQERANYLNRIEDANEFLKSIVTLITHKDKEALIIIASDHGGYVGFKYTMESRKRVLDSDLVRSIFSSNLSIKWPNAPDDHFKESLNSNVNLFRVLFSYLSENNTYLNQLEEDKSYMQIYEGAPFGVYEYINENGEVVFESIEDN